MDRELAPGKNEARIIELDGKLAVEIQLQRGKVCLIDPEDWERVRHHRWHWKWESRKVRDRQRLYVATTVWVGEEGRHKATRIHRLLMDAPAGLMVDHRRGDPLDNRRSNLRVCENFQNQANSGSRGGSSRFKGVSWNSRKKRWLVAFRANKQYHFVGYFRDEVEAARAYDQAILAVCPTFARLNFPETMAEMAEMTS